MNTVEFHSNTDNSQLDGASASWPDSSWTMGEYSYTSVPQGTNSGLISAPVDLSMVGPCVLDFNTTGYAAFIPAPTTEMGMFTNLPTAQVDYAYQNPWMSVPPIFNASSTVTPLPLVGGPYCAGVAPLTAYSADTTPDLGMSTTSATPTSPSQDEWPWNSDLLRSSCTIPASPSRHEGEVVWDVLEPGTNLSETTISQVGWDSREFSSPTPAVPGTPGHVVSNATAMFTPIVALGKRHREAEVPQGNLVWSQTQEVPPQKRARGSGITKGILKAVPPATGAHHELVARVPKTKKSNKPKAGGRGAERLVTPSAQGICYQSLPGPSSQRDWVVGAADEKVTWVEGSADGEAAHHIDKTAQKQEGGAMNKLFEIPHIFEPDHRMLLQASESDFARGAVQAIKCRLCANAKFKNFQEFKRHCAFTETHPLVIHFCNQCGDFFARSDSLARHGKQRPPECRRATPETAAQKRRETKEAHEKFIQDLKTGQDIGKPFSRIIKDKYPKSSKKRTGNRKRQ